MPTGKLLLSSCSLVIEQSPSWGGKKSQCWGVLSNTSAVVSQHLEVSYRHSLFLNSDLLPFFLSG